MFESLIAMQLPSLPPSLAKLFATKSSRNNQNNGPSLIYGTVVAQSRKSAFYTQFMVPDTVIGRYDMLALHVFMLTHRLKQSREENNKGCNWLSQNVFDLFIIDLERGLRELGFADTSVHKRKKRMVRSFYALIDEFEKPLNDSNKTKLAKAIAPRYFDKIEPGMSANSASELAAYMIDTAQFLSLQSDQAITAGTLNWLQLEE